jgi:hypothetical protein
MQSKIIRSISPVKAIKYPCLMHYQNKFVVLFCSPKCGVVVAAESGREVGDFSNNWSTTLFEPFDGEVTLSNN